MSETSETSAPKRCHHMSTCEMYKILTFAGTLKAWKINYCEGDFTRCERYARSLCGAPVPSNLMPNGALLRKRKPAGE